MDLSTTQKKLYSYWCDWVKAHNGLPARKDIDVRQVGKYLPHVVVFDILEPLDFRYRLVGTEVRLHTHSDYTGKLLSEMDGKGPGSEIWLALDQTRQNCEPLFREVPYVGPHEAYMRSTLLFLPLSDNHETPDKIFLVSNFISKNPL